MLGKKQMVQNLELRSYSSCLAKILLPAAFVVWLPKERRKKTQRFQIFILARLKSSDNDFYYKMESTRTKKKCLPLF